MGRESSPGKQRVQAVRQKNDPPQSTQARGRGPRLAFVSSDFGEDAGVAFDAAAVAQENAAGLQAEEMTADLVLLGDAIGLMASTSARESSGLESSPCGDAVESYTLTIQVRALQSGG